MDAIQTHSPEEHDTTVENAEHVQEMLEKVEGVQSSSDDRPDWLPEKFGSAEELAEAYQNLEQEFHTRNQEEPQEYAQEPQEVEEYEEGDEVTSNNIDSFLEGYGLDYQKFEEEFNNTGGLSDAAYQALDEAGIPSEMVDNYLEGQMAMAEQIESNVYEAVGGQENYNMMTEWASDNLDQYEIEAFNHMMESADTNQINFAIQGLASRYLLANQDGEPNLVSGSGGEGMGSRYESVQQLTSAMSDPRYHNDPAYRREVTDRLSRSNIM